MWLQIPSTSTLLTGYTSVGLFSFLKAEKRSTERLYSKDLDVISFVRAWFEGKNGLFFREGILEVKGQREKCVRLGVGYIEVEQDIL